MEAATAAGTGGGTASRTVADLLPNSVERFGSQAAIMFKEPSGKWVQRTYEEVGETVRTLSLGLIGLGIEKGDKVAILANTRPEWTYVDFAALTAGATVVPIYQTNSPDECLYVLENSDARVVFVEDAEQLEKVQAVRDRLPKLEHVILIEGDGRRRDHPRRPRRARRGARSLRLGGALPLGQPRGRLHVHLHVGDHRAAEGLRDHATATTARCST